MSTKKKVLSLLGIIVLIGAFYMLYEHLTYISTDNAQVQGNTLMIAPKVSGFISKVNVRENQAVKAGEVLAEIQMMDYDNSLKQMEGELHSVQARAQDAEKNYNRLSGLFKKGVISQQQFDTSDATYRETRSKLASMQAQVSQAKLNAGYTQIKAPSDGVIARKSVEIGMLAPVGTPLFGFVTSDERWVVANFKETELSRIHIGQKVDVEVDALPKSSFVGEVESISPTTGATFTLLPPDNATGNFTKVVQRVPVRIKFLNLDAKSIELLRAGLSANVHVRLR
ncbi:MAG: HlyD family secretion protein [Methylotenera sp.]|nr:HlyD family secretion protein [Oligoflexia bacterium]